VSRFANRAASAVLTLPGGCLCPGAPHESDWIRLRTEAGAAETLAMAQLGSNIGAIQTLALEWNLLDDDGKPAELNAENVGRLFSENFDELDAWMEEHVKLGSLPKASAGPSSTGTPGSDTPNRATRRQRRSTRS
jgi:hypothetical protein